MLSLGDKSWQTRAMNRIAIFVLAPVMAAAVGGLLSWATGAHARGVSVAVFYLLQLYVLQLLFGVAIHAWLRRTGRLSLASSAIGGMAMVAVVAVPYLMWASFRPENTPVRSVIVLIIWLTLGGITGISAFVLSRYPHRRRRRRHSQIYRPRHRR